MLSWISLPNLKLKDFLDGIDMQHSQQLSFFIHLWVLLLQDE